MTTVEDRIYVEPVPPPIGICIIDSPIKRDLVQYNLCVPCDLGDAMKMESFMHHKHNINFVESINYPKPQSQGLKHLRRWRELAGNEGREEEKETFHRRKS
ncbi:hypothetical protein DD606_25550 [Enterobacter cloacae complex sp. GF14B]|nr:hypothetical protein DD606_25550 [Enterobacter cloacae complex sp. GF14B]